MLIPCPYEGCTFEADTDEKMSEHVEYMLEIKDNQHKTGNLKF
jgi:hypothetical protein